MMQKKILRKNLLEKRCHVDIHSAVLTKKIGHYLKYYQPKCIGFYWPLEGEFDARQSVIDWITANPSCLAALPVINETQKILHFHKWRPGMPMIIGKHNIPIPAKFNLIQPDLLLIPCLGFDRENYRLGYGGGFYDRTLAHLSIQRVQLITLGIAFKTGEIDCLPREPHDLPLNAIITDRC